MSCVDDIVCAFFPFARPLPFPEETGRYGQDGESDGGPKGIKKVK
jgi:hypothetical protein